MITSASKGAFTGLTNLQTLYVLKALTHLPLLFSLPIDTRRD